MKTDRLVLGAFETNSYILRDNETAKDCVIIDTGLGAQPLLGFLESNELRPAALMLTHGHADHIAAVNELRRRYPQMKLYIHKLDAAMLSDPITNLSGLAGLTVTTDPPDVTVEDGDFIEQAQMKFDILHTPGHTPGGICFYARADDAVFVGDTLFAASVGRTDFPGGDFNQLIDSIKRRLFTLPDKTTVYPGHGPATTIAQEKAFNPFVR